MDVPDERSGCFVFSTFFSLLEFVSVVVFVSMPVLTPANVSLLLLFLNTIHAVITTPINIAAAASLLKLIITPLLAGSFFSSIPIAILIFSHAAAGGVSDASNTFFAMGLSELISSIFIESFSHTAAGGITSISYNLFCNSEFILLFSVFYLSRPGD